MTTYSKISDRLGGLTEHLSPRDALEIQRRIDSTTKSKFIALLLHLLAGFGAPFFYLGRPGAAIRSIISMPALVLLLFVSSSVSFFIPLLLGPIVFLVWIFGFI